MAKRRPRPSLSANRRPRRGLPRWPAARERADATGDIAAAGQEAPGLRAPETGLDLAAVAADARLLEEVGYDGVAIEETKQDPYIVMALAAAATTRLRVSTAIAMAFPRSPTITAMSAWTLQKLAKGRFTLGLGPQVRAHIERRYGLVWSAPKQCVVLLLADASGSVAYCSTPSAVDPNLKTWTGHLVADDQVIGAPLGRRCR